MLLHAETFARYLTPGIGFIISPNIFNWDIDWHTTLPWVFSGFGVALVGSFGKWLYKISKHDKSAHELIPVAPIASTVNISDSRIEGPVAGRDVNIETYIQNGSPPVESRDQYHEHPTPNAISMAVDKAALYLQPTVESSYVGLKVRWQSKLRRIVPRQKKGEIAVQFQTLAEPTLHVIVQLDEYPILKTVRGGELVEITGTIERVQSSIFLADARLKFLH
jgi:hypothetical protein